MPDLPRYRAREMWRGGVTAIVLAHDSGAHLEACLEALFAQTHPPLETLLVDNASRDGACERAARRFPVQAIRLERNLGYAAGNDLAIARARGEAVLLLNPDCRLAPDYLALTLETLASAPDVAGVQGKLLKGPGGPIDSTGIVLTRARRNFDRGEGEPDRGQWDAPGEVFGVSGAAAVLRRSALQDVALEGEPLDASYFMYREDVDLCWRARLLGWRFLYQPRAMAWHARGFGRADRRRAPRALRHASLRNRWATIVKNDDLGSLLRALPRMLAFEAAQAAWVLLREPSLLLAYGDALARLPATARKRRALQARRRVPAAELERWLT